MRITKQISLAIAILLGISCGPGIKISTVYNKNYSFKLANSILIIDGPSSKQLEAIKLIETIHNTTINKFSAKGCSFLEYEQSKPELNKPTLQQFAQSKNTSKVFIVNIKKVTLTGGSSPGHIQADVIVFDLIDKTEIFKSEFFVTIDWPEVDGVNRISEKFAVNLILEVEKYNLL